MTVPMDSWTWWSAIKRLTRERDETRAEVARLVGVLGRIADMTKGEPSMQGTRFRNSGTAGLIGRVHNTVREAFGEDPLTIAKPRISARNEEADALRAEVARLREALNNAMSLVPMRPDDPVNTAVWRQYTDVIEAIRALEDEAITEAATIADGDEWCGWYRPWPLDRMSEDMEL